MGNAAAKTQVQDPHKRDFLRKVGLAGAAALGAGALTKGIAERSGVADPEGSDWTLDSAFKPRADQLNRVTGRK